MVFDDVATGLLVVAGAVKLTFITVVQLVSRREVFVYLRLASLVLDLGLSHCPADVCLSTLGVHGSGSSISSAGGGGTLVGST